MEIRNQLADENLELERRKELEEELRQAVANTTQEELQRAELLDQETQTERILREAQERRDAISQQILELEQQRDEEVAIQESLLEEKAALEQSFTERFGQEIDKRKQKEIDAINEIKQAYLELIALRAQA